jgi:hypothetical protein
MIASHPYIHVGLILAYDLPASMFLLVFAAYNWNRPNELEWLARSFVLCVLLAVPIYALVPVSGPLYAFKTFPIDPGKIMPRVIYLSQAPPNGIPSVHMATALLTWYFGKRFWYLRLPVTIYLCMIVVTTLGIGEHYVVDLIVAVPYTSLIVWLARYDRKADTLGGWSADLPSKISTTESQESLVM